MSAPDEGIPAEGGDTTTETPPPVVASTDATPPDKAVSPEEAPPGKPGSSEQEKRTSGDAKRGSVGDAKRGSVGDAKRPSGSDPKRGSSGVDAKKSSLGDSKKSSFSDAKRTSVDSKSGELKPGTLNADGSPVEPGDQPKGEDGEHTKSVQPSASGTGLAEAKLSPLTHPVGEIEELAGIPGSKTGGGGAAADTLATDLAGTLQTFFTQEETKPDANAFKPLRRPKLTHQNTYRMQAYNPFHPDRVQKVLDQSLPELLANVKYNVDTANDVAAKISEKIRTRILALRFDRYKIIVLTSIGPVSRQGVHIAFRCLWDVDKDSYSYGSFKNSHIFCSVSVYGIYFE